MITEVVTHVQSSKSNVQVSLAMHHSASNLFNDDLEKKPFYQNGCKLQFEWLPFNDPQVEQLLKLWPSARLVALGGATEVTVWSNAFQLQRVDPAWRSVPYGKPIWNHQSLRQNIGGTGHGVTVWKEHFLSVDGNSFLSMWFVERCKRSEDRYLLVLDVIMIGPFCPIRHLMFEI